MTACPHCGQPRSRDDNCSFCIEPKGYSAEGALLRYFLLLSRSGAPALDPSQEDTRGGAVGPVSYALHERARLARVLDLALGEGWVSTETGRALQAFFGGHSATRVQLAAETRGESLQTWGALANEALTKIRRALENKGLLRIHEGGEMREVEPPEEIYTTWEEVADYLSKSTRTLQKWYYGTGGAEDPCGIRQAVRIVGRRVHAKESEIRKCFERLYGGVRSGE